MPLKEKNKLLKCAVLLFMICVMAAACGSGKKEQSTEEKKMQDSLKVVEQKQKIDSLKRNNPFLILPPRQRIYRRLCRQVSFGDYKIQGIFQIWPPARCMARFLPEWPDVERMPL